MGSTFQRSKELVKSAWTVLRADKELMLLPLLSFFSTAVLALLVAGPVLLNGRTDTADGGTSFHLSGLGYVILFVLYIALAYVTIFFNAALVSAADERLKGGDPTVGSALRGAANRAGAILPWAVVSATVSIVLRAVRDRGGLLGRLAASIAGIAWSLVTFLVLPILVIEGIGVGDAIKRSRELFKRTWGEQVVSNMGISLLSFVAVLCGLPLLLLASVGGPAAILGIGLFVLWIGVVVCASAAMSGIVQTALYHYATTGRAPEAFANVGLERAFVESAGQGRRRGF